MYNAFIERLKTLKLPMPEELPYGNDVRVFKLQGVTPESVEPLARFVGTQRLSVFPRYHSIETGVLSKDSSRSAPHRLCHIRSTASLAQSGVCDAAASPPNGNS